MTLSDIASIGTLASGVAVLISLIYLTLQVRQADRNQRAFVNQEATSRFTAIILRLNDPPFSDLHYRAMNTKGAVTSQEACQLLNFVLVLGHHVLDAWVQRRARLIDELMFESALRPACILLSNPIYRAVWPMVRPSFPREFGEMFDREICSVPIREPVDLAKQLKANLAEL